MFFASEILEIINNPSNHFVESCLLLNGPRVIVFRLYELKLPLGSEFHKYMFS